MGQQGVTNRYVIHISTRLCYRLLCQKKKKNRKVKSQMLSLEEGIAIDGIFKTRKWSRSREMVFGHSIRRVFAGRIFSSCHSENLNGFEWIHWAMLLKKKGRVKLSCLQSCFWGASPKGTSDLLGPNVFSSRKKKSLEVFPSTYCISCLSLGPFPWLSL